MGDDENTKMESDSKPKMHTGWKYKGAGAYAIFIKIWVGGPYCCQGMGVHHFENHFEFYLSIGFINSNIGYQMFPIEYSKGYFAGGRQTEYLILIRTGRIFGRFFMNVQCFVYWMFINKFLEKFTKWSCLYPFTPLLCIYWEMLIHIWMSQFFLSKRNSKAVSHEIVLVFRQMRKKVWISF